MLTEGACRTPRDDHAEPAKNSGWTVRKNVAYSAARSWSYVHEPSTIDPATVIRITVDGDDALLRAHNSRENLRKASSEKVSVRYFPVLLEWYCFDHELP